MFETPILFLIFNRPNTTVKVFEKIRELKPKYLYVGADGPRPNYPNDALLCAETRNIVSIIDWDCQVKTLFNKRNLGCGLSPANAISWFFEHVEEGIILEDDCLPNSSFFKYCESLLGYYRNNEKVMMICGTSYQPKALNIDTYYFSKYPHIWGWATWKRAWAKYKFSFDTESNQAISSVIKKEFKHNRERYLWNENMQLIKNGLDAWDYQLMYWMWKNDGLCIVPWRNTIANIGFGLHATHTIDADSSQSKMTQYEVSNIIHPKKVINDKKADKYERYHILIDSDFKYYVKKLKAVADRLRKLINKVCHVNRLLS
jgi:hypothetical protein